MLQVYNHKNRAFTLIELLVVIAIIGLLATVVTTSLSKARSKALDTKRIAEVRELQKAIEMYYDDHGSYPCTNSGDPTTLYIDKNVAASSCLRRDLVPEYISQLPIDPKFGDDTTKQWGYQYNYSVAGPKAYLIRTTLAMDNYELTSNNPASTTTCDDPNLEKCSWHENCGFYRGYGPSCAYTYHLGNSE